MTRSQFVLYMSQPSIVVTLKIVHEQQSKKGKGRGKLDVESECVRKGGLGKEFLIQEKSSGWAHPQSEETPSKSESEAERDGYSDLVSSESEMYLSTKARY